MYSMFVSREGESSRCPSPSTARDASSRAVSTPTYSRRPFRQRARELGEPVLLDLALRVEPERLLDLDLDPEALAVEAVLVALVEAAHRLVALEDVLQRPAPGVWTPIGLFAVIGPSMKLQLGPPRICSRSVSNVPLAFPPLEHVDARARGGRACPGAS